MSLGRDQRKIVAVGSRQCKRKPPDPESDLTGSRVEEEQIAVIPHRLQGNNTYFEVVSYYRAWGRIIGAEREGSDAAWCGRRARGGNECGSLASLAPPSTKHPFETSPARKIHHELVEQLYK